MGHKTRLVSVASMLLLAAWLAGCAAGGRTSDLHPVRGHMLLGQRGRHFRVIEYDVEYSLDAPPGWGTVINRDLVIPSIGQRSGDSLAFVSPGKDRFVRIDVDDHHGSPAGLRARPEKNLEDLRQVMDWRIRLDAEPGVTLPDGRRFPVWRYSGPRWGQRLSVLIPQGTMGVTIEVFDADVKAERAALRRLFDRVLATCRVGRAAVPAP